MQLLAKLLLVFLILHVGVAVYAANDEPELPQGRASIVRTPAQLVDAGTLAGLSQIQEADHEITWQTYVPNAYDPNVPAGLLVFVSPTPEGWLPLAWQPVLDEQNVIMISADLSGNGTRTKRRLLHALLAPYAAAELYNIDTRRIYVSGFSGGGKVASIAAIQFANLFTGAMYICGVETWPDVGAERLALAKSHRYVFVSGSDDFNRNLTRRLYAKYSKAGLQNVDLLIVPGMAHSIPDEKYFREAMQFLEARD